MPSSPPTDTPSSSSPKSSSHGARWKAGSLMSLGLLLLVWLAYWMVSQPFFVRSILFPKIEEALGARLEADIIEFGPFSSLECHNVVLRSTDGETLVQIQDIRIEYDWFACLQGVVAVERCLIEKLQITTEQTADKEDPLVVWMGSFSGGDDSGLPPLRLRNILLKDCQWIHRQGGDGEREQKTYHLKGFDIDQIGQGLVTEGQLSGQWVMEEWLDDVMKDRLVMDIQTQGGFEFKDTGLWDRCQLSGTLKVLEGSGRHDQLKGYQMALESQWSLSGIERADCVFLTTEGVSQRIHLSGPLDFRKREGQLHLHMDPLEERNLQLLGAFAGLDIRSGTLGGDLWLDLSKGGSSLSVRCEVQADQMSIKALDHPTPPVSLVFSTSGAVDLVQRKVMVREGRLTASDSDHVWLTAELDKFLTFSWGISGEDFQDPSILLQVEHLDLQPWLNWIDSGLPLESAWLDGQGAIEFAEHGRSLQTRLNMEIKEADWTLQERTLEKTQMKIEMEAQWEDFTTVVLEELKAELRDAENQPWGSVTLSAMQQDDERMGVPFQASGQADLKRWLAWWDPAHAALSQGQLLWNAQMHWQPDQWKGVVQTDLRGVSGRWKSMSFEDYSVALNLDAEYHNQQLRMGNCHLEVRQRAHRGGSMGWHGMMDTQSGKGDISFFTVGLNHHALKPFLPKGSEFGSPPAWEDAKIHLDGRWTAEDFEKGSMDADITVDGMEGLHVEGQPQGALKATLALEGQWDAAQWQLLPSSLVVEGLSETKTHLDFHASGQRGSDTASPVRLELRGDYVDLDAAMHWWKSKGVAEASAKEISKDPLEAESENPGVLSWMIIGGSLDRVDYAGVPIEKLSFAAESQNQTIQCHPLSFSLEGQALSIGVLLEKANPTDWAASVDFNGDQLPANALWSVIKGEPHPRIPGFLSVHGSFKGVPLGESIPISALSGDGAITYEGAEWKMVGPWTKTFLLPITTLLRLPTLFSKPIEGMEATFAFNDGILNLQGLEVQSSAFQAQTKGDIQLQADWMQTPVDLPVVFKLERSIAEKSNLLPKNVADNEDYVPLPPFLHLSGTLSELHLDKDAWRLGGFALRSALGLPGGAVKETVKVVEEVGDKTKKVIEGLGGGKLIHPVLDSLLPKSGKDNNGNGSEDQSQSSLPEKGLNLLQGIFRQPFQATNPNHENQTPEAEHKKDE